MNPMMLRMAFVLLTALAAFVVGAFVISRMRKNLAQESNSIPTSPLAADGLPIHSYHAVIQELKQQKHELTAQHQAEKRKARVADTLSAAMLGNLPCGVLLFNTSGLVRQANPAARELLGFASPIGLAAADLFYTGKLLSTDDCPAHDNLSVFEALSPALGGTAAIRGLLIEHVRPDGEIRMLELSVAPVMAEDASLLGTSMVLADKSEIAALRRHEETKREIAAEMALSLRTSLTAIAGYAQQLAHSRDSGLTHQLADDIAHETAQLDRTVGSFLAGAKAAKAAAGS